MNYRQLQQALKIARNNGLTTIKLNAKKEVLEAEYNRIYGAQPADLRDSVNSIHTDEEILGFVIQLAIQKGHSEAVAPTIANLVMDTWKTEGYCVAFNRFLKVLLAKPNCAA